MEKRPIFTLPGEPRAAVFVVVCSIAAGLMIALSWWFAVGDVESLGDRTVIFGLFAALLVLLEAKPMNEGDAQRSATFSWTFAFTLLLIAPLSFALTANICAALVGEMIRWRRGRETEIAWGFVGVRSTISLFAAGVVGGAAAELDAVTRGSEPDLGWLGAVLGALAVGFVVNALIAGTASAFEQRVPVIQSVRSRSFSQLRTDGYLFGLAPIFAVVGASALILMPVLLMVVWVILHSASVALTNEHQATTDVLTGIPNRRTFETRGTQMLEAAQLNGEHAAVIHLDLDGFKAINDRLGHQYGDGVLRQLAERLENSRRSTDLVARLGGDEFAIVLRPVGGASDAESVARRILYLVEEQLSVEGIPLQVSASLGVAMFPEHGDNLATVLHHADLAMYRSKTDDVGVSLFSSGTALAPGRLSLVGELGAAIENGELTLHYQPKVHMDSGKILSVEALLRWNHPEHGQVSPEWFMPMAEQTDMMRDLTDFVLKSALEQCAAWHRKGIMVGVAVNASARNLHDVRFPNRIASFLKDKGLEPGWLELEITENTIMEDPRRSSAILAEVRSLGVHISIDDFGTGYSSLASLRDLTIDRIKIDRSFVVGLTEGSADLTIVRSVVELGRNLGLSVVAEGVETDEVLAIVRGLGVDEFQGFLASHPMSPEELEPVLIHGFFEMGEPLRNHDVASASTSIEPAGTSAPHRASKASVRSRT